jgi:phospholipase A1
MFRTLLLACSLFVWLFGAPGVSAYSVEDYDRCSAVENREKRLQCYEEAAGRKPKTDVPALEPAGQPPGRAAIPAAQAPSASAPPTDAPAGLAACRDHDYSADRLRCYDEAARYSWWRCLTDCVWGTGLFRAKKTDGIEACKTLCDDKERLYAYDRLAGLNPKPPNTSSYLSKAWLLDERSREEAGRWAIRAHRENYFLVYTYNGALDRQPYESVNPGTHLQDAETKFQISLKMKLLEDIPIPILDKKADLWAAYTQLSQWQFWNWSNSAPFRETNYEPEALFNIRMGDELVRLGGEPLKLQFVQIGLNHQSNGQSEPLSRSWNRLVANFGFERVPFDVVLKTWYRLPESADDDDNPDIDAYLGYGELWAGYRGRTCGIDYHAALMFRNNLRLDDGNRSALQLAFDFTCVGPLNCYIQYFTGYGETLIDYNHYTNRIGAGVMIRDW